jgi:hypothetical protein
MATDRKNEPKLAEAAAKTTAALENLRSRLNRSGSLEAAEIGDLERPDELEGELEEYFAAERIASSNRSTTPGTSAETSLPREIRAEVIDGVVAKILSSWGALNGEIPPSIKSEVIGRLVDHVLAELLKKGATPR